MDVVLETQFLITAVEAFVEVVEVVRLGVGASETVAAKTEGCAARARKGVGDYCEGEEGNTVSFC